MRALINALSTVGARTGIGHYTNELLRCLAQQQRPAKSLSSPARLGTAGRPVVGAVAPKILRVPRAGGLSLFRAWRPELAPALAWPGAHNGLALLERNFRAHAGAARMTLPRAELHPAGERPAVVVTIHDLSVLLHPEWHPRARCRPRTTLSHWPAALRPFPHRLGNVAAGGDSHPGRSPEQVTRVYNGVRPGLGRCRGRKSAKTLQRLGLPLHYLLYLGTIEPPRTFSRC